MPVSIIFKQQHGNEIVNWNNVLLLNIKYLNISLFSKKFQNISNKYFSVFSLSFLAVRILKYLQNETTQSTMKLLY